MSKLNFMEKLLDGAEVEWRALGEVILSLKTGLNPRQNFQLNTPDAKNYYVTVREIQNGQIVFLDKTDRVNDKALALISNRSNLNTGDVLFSGTGTVGRTAVIEKKPVNWNIKEGVYVIKPIQDAISPRYLSHLLNTSYIVKDYSKKIVGSPVISLPMSELKKLPIPIPCPENPKKSLEIQAEIVRILDTFSELTTELTAELNLRKKQYNYYRDQLLRFEEGEVEWKTLGEVALKSYSGGTPTAGTKEYYDSGTIPWLRTQEVKFADIERTEIKITPAALQNSATKWIPINCVIVAISGATAGRSAINKIPLTTNQHCCCLEVDPEKALYRYVFHWVSFNHENLKGLGQGARGDLNSAIIKGFNIPIPYSDDPEKSLAEQARIVAILDKFDTLTTSITEGLPREIALRKKQYEYYRDLLLSFPKPDAEEAA